MCMCVSLLLPSPLRRHADVVDTPGHSDFGAQVQHVLHLVDAVLLVVCAREGVMPQTQYVLQNALRSGKQPIVVINKADRLGPEDQDRLSEVENEVFDLFVRLDADDTQLEYRTCVAPQRWRV